MGHVRDVDSARQTVLMVQVENMDPHAVHLYRVSLYSYPPR